ncbi:MAG TPA: branched-chain amino acid ABC transporter permease [Pseudolabrys sp.]|nr:branched-chain amino acid ABC transporter permease [Pseudolabrys sp.]
MLLLRLARRPFFWVIALIVAAFVIAPLIGDDVDLRESLVLDALYIILASNLNLMLGYTGYINFGSIVFFGLGGYFCLWLVSAFGLSLWASLLLAGIGVSLLALIFGLGILKLRGHFFALATIGIIEGIQAFVQNFKPWGGSAGLYLSGGVLNQIGGAANALWVIYFLMVAVMGLSLYLSYAVKRSKFGLGLLAIGQNEDAAAVLGVPTPLYKALAYCTSAFLPAIAGGLFFFKSAFIEPASAFDLTLSTEVIVVVMLGGQGTVFGVALGALLYSELRGYLLTTATFSNFQLVISGVLLLLIVLFFPGGLMGWIYSRFPRTQKVLE